MIVISAAAVAIAILLLVAGMITSNLAFVYVSIGVSVAAAVLLAAGVIRRRELFVREAQPQTGAATAPAAGATAGATAATGGAAPGALAVDGLAADARSADLRSADLRSADVRSGSQQVATGERTASDDAAAAERTSGRVLAGAGQGAFRTSRSGAASAPPDSDVVVVVPGRRHFHLPGCARLTGRLTEQLTVNEAVEEGFTACTTCLPGSVPGAWTAGQDADTAFTAAGPEPVAWAATVAMPPIPDSGEPAAQSPWRVTMEPVAFGAADTVAAEAAKPEPVTPADEASTDADADSAGTGTANAGDPAETVWVLRGVSRYHLRDCVLIVDDDDIDAMTLAAAETDGCTPCRACHID